MGNLGIMKNWLIVIALASLAGCSSDPSTCGSPCVVDLDSTWMATASDMYVRDVAGAVPGLKAGDVCQARRDGKIIAGAWLVEDPGSWVVDYAEKEDPQSYVRETHAQIQAVQAPMTVECARGGATVDGSLGTHEVGVTVDAGHLFTTQQEAMSACPIGWAPFPTDSTLTWWTCQCEQNCGPCPDGWHKAGPWLATCERDGGVD